MTSIASTSITRRHEHPRRVQLLPAAGALLFLLLTLSADVVEAGNLFSSSSSCAPVTTADPFDLEAYAVHPWYVQEQQVTSYQPLDALYCVRASYTVAQDGDSVSVLNTANVVGWGTMGNKTLAWVGGGSVHAKKHLSSF